MKHCDAAFKKEVRLSCYDALTSVGFTRFRKEGVDWPLEGGFHCWVGLNTGLHDDYVQINPFIGVHSVPIEKMWTSLTQGKYPGKYDRGCATYATHIGTLAPDERIVRFRRDSDVQAEANRLAEMFVRVALPYAKSIASYEALLPLLQPYVDALGAYPEKVACCLFLMGRASESREFTERFLTGHEDYFEGFALPFLKMIAAQEAKSPARS